VPEVEAVKLTVHIYNDEIDEKFEIEIEEPMSEIKSQFPRFIRRLKDYISEWWS
jgi:hypothetical protein